VSHLLTFAARMWRDGGDAVRGELLVAFEPHDYSEGGPPHARQAPSRSEGLGEQPGRVFLVSCLRRVAQWQ